jgi:gamma-glutamyltranspeptidase/glutathione hydrolase
MRRLLLVVSLLVFLLVLAGVAGNGVVHGGSQPVRAKKGMVVSSHRIASDVGAQVLRDGGRAIDAAVATAFALAVVHPSAGNIGGGGFIVFRQASGDAVAYDFRETAPSGAAETMFLKDGTYDSTTHHNSRVAVGVPGTVAGLHAAWKEHGRLPWRRLVDPAIKLARDGFPLSFELARSLSGVLAAMKPYPASVAQFSKHGVPYEAGEILRQPDLARTLQRIGANGPTGFYEGETALLIETEMKAHGGLITRDDLGKYQARKRTPIRGSYRGYEIYSMPPASSGGVALVEMLNVLEGYDLKRSGHASAATVHLVAEAMRRAFADRARHLGDPEFSPQMPVERLISKDYAAELRKTISATRASASSPTTFEWPAESEETTHLSVVDVDRNAVALTFTLEAGFGSKIVVPGAGFLLNNEMGDFNAAPGLTTPDGLIGTVPNLAAPGKRMLSSMTPTVVAKDGKVMMVTGSPGSRTIINTVLLTILNVVDFGMNAQESVDAPRFHHQWLPDRITFEPRALSPDTIALLRAKGHELREGSDQGEAEVIVYVSRDDMLEGASDRRRADGGVAVQ